MSEVTQEVRIRLVAAGERAVLLARDGETEHELDPGKLALAADLPEALHEWARVALAVQRSNPDGPDGAAGAVIARRGRQLAGRLAASMGMPVGYVDPISGEESTVDPPAGAAGEPAQTPPDRPAEPVPWPTGLTVSAFVFALVFYAVLTLAVTLAATNPLLAVGSNVVVTVGLLPSIWLVRNTPIWRWIGLGVAAAIGAGWLALPFILF